MENLVEMITCRQCGQLKPASRSTPGWCEDCEKAYNNRMSYRRNQNGDWMEVAKDSGLEIYERQPGETQLEWSIWLAYRDSYPGAKPSYKGVAEKVGTTYNYVRTTAARWNYNIRMQAWMTECDKITMAQRRQEILDMNKEHIDMAAKLRGKLNQAIEQIDPYELRPAEINALMKTATELERKARVDDLSQEAMLRESFVDNENPELKKSPTKQNDLGEVVNILLQAGVLGDITTIGVRKTETTEVLVGDAQGNTSSLIRED